MTALAGSNSSTTSPEDKVYRKVMRRIVPLLFLCYTVAYLDRVNIGFAKLQMLGDLNLSDTVYAIGASIFFWGYFLFEVPSNILLHKVGARFWISRIMVTWGIVSASMMFTAQLAQFFHTEPSTVFYVLRFLLGVCEAGFFPGVILYLNYWFPSDRQSKVFSGFLIALPISLVVGGPLSGWLMESMHDFLSLRGWQWMLLLEGLPAIVLGLVVFFYLDDGIDKAKWLSEAEKNILRSNLDAENSHKSHRLLAALKDIRIWFLIGIMLTYNTGFYGLSFWLPSIIRAGGMTNAFHIGLLTAIPYSIAAIVMVANAAHSNYTGERRFHAAIPAFVGGTGLILSAMAANNIALSIFFLTFAASGIIGLMPIFWTFPGRLLSGSAAAAGLAIINSIGSLSGFAGSMITGIAKDLTGDINNGTYILGGSLLVCGLLILSIPKSMFSNRVTASGTTLGKVSRTTI